MKNVITKFFKLQFGKIAMKQDISPNKKQNQIHKKIHANNKLIINKNQIKK